MHISYICEIFFHSFRFLSNSSDSLLKSLVGNSHETLEILKRENVDND